MRENALFEINVYRCTLEKHKLQTLRVKNRYDSTVKNLDSILYSSGEIYTYHYNELIGVMVLQPFCSQIRGYLYLENAKRRRYGIRKKNFIPPMGKCLELSICQSWSSEQIYKELYEDLLLVCKDIRREHNGACVDLEAFVNIGQYVDWRRLLTQKGVIADNKMLLHESL